MGPQPKESPAAKVPGECGNGGNSVAHPPAPNMHAPASSQAMAIATVAKAALSSLRARIQGADHFRESLHTIAKEVPFATPC